MTSTESTKTLSEKTKELPHSQESEMIVLGSMLSSTSSLNIGADGLNETDFYFKEHKAIFQALKAAHLSDKPADIHLIGEELSRQGKLESIGGISYLTSLAQYAGTAAHMEEYIETVKNKSTLRKLTFFGQDISREAVDNQTNADDLLDKYREEFERIYTSNVRTIPIPSMEARLSSLEDKLKQLRGKKYLGLCQRTLPDLDEKFSGLRKLIVLAAAPNVGKTALTNQLVVDVLKTHSDACVVYFSLEMTEDDLLIRLLCNQTQLDYRTFVMGRDTTNGGLIKEAFFNEQDLKLISEAESFLKGLHNRLQIIDKERCPFLTSSQAIAHIEAVKARTGCNRVFVVIDYLQVWPLNPQAKFFNENEIDKWRIGEALKIRNALNGDPIIVISEARKPQGDEKWGGDMSAVMGAARMTYSPDAVLLFSQLDFQDIHALWGSDGKISKHRKKSSSSQKPTDEEVEKLMEYLENEGISLCRLDMPKGRDGMQKFSMLLEFHYRKNVFKAANFLKIKAESEKYKLNGRRNK